MSSALGATAAGRRAINPTKQSGRTEPQAPPTSVGERVGEHLGVGLPGAVLAEHQRGSCVSEVDHDGDRARRGTRHTGHAGQRCQREHDGSDGEQTTHQSCREYPLRPRMASIVERLSGSEPACQTMP